MLKRISNSIPYWVFNMLSLLSSAATIITFIFSCYSIYLGVLGEGYKIKFSIYCVFITGLLLGFVVVFFKMRKYGALLAKTKSNFSREYNLFLKGVKDYQYDIMKQHKEDKRIDHLSVDTLTLITHSFAKDSLDRLCRIIETITGSEVSAYIKLIIMPHGIKYSDSIDCDIAEVETFCRSEHTHSSRKESDQKGNYAKVKDNTDFYNILRGSTDNAGGFFYQTDLVECARKMKELNSQYLNTTPHYLDYYKSTIVVPIKADKVHTHFFSDNIGCDILGFLCIDSLSTDVFRNTEYDKDVFVNIIQSFAEPFYVAFNQYRYYMREGRNKNE